MSLNPEQYLALSSLSHESIPKDIPSEGLLLSDLIKNNNIDTSRLDLRGALSSLSSWTIVNVDTASSGMSAFAVQNPQKQK